MLRDALAREISKIAGGVEIKISEPERPENGDFSTNAAFLRAKKEGRKPQDIAQELAEQLASSKIVKRSEAKSGFLNIFLKDEVLLKALGEGVQFPKKKEKINIEFVSANPTGPLTMANARGGFLGDALSNILKKCGYNVIREYYINDAGGQVRLLSESILAAEGKLPPKDEHYQGVYVKELKGQTADQAIAIILDKIKSSLQKAGISLDVWFSENQNLRKTGELEKMLKILESKGLAEKREGAIWFGPPAGGRVLIKSNGEPTYLLADLAYQHQKLTQRKFDRAITVVGADHQAEVVGVLKGIESLGIPSGRLKIFITQLVRLVSGGKEVKMSKRKGEFITLEELLNEVGLDAARWFFLSHAPETHMDFDLDLAKERSEKNPVYYVQYAHTRMASILGKSNSQPSTKNYKLFGHPSERVLVVKILRYPELLEAISRDYQIHRLTTYAYELAQTFSAFYRDVKVIGSEREAELLYLVSKAKETLADLLKLMGISQPEKM